MLLYAFSKIEGKKEKKIESRSERGERQSLKTKCREGFITITQFREPFIATDQHCCSEGERWVVSNCLPNTRQGIFIPPDFQVLQLRIAVSLHRFTRDIFSAYRDSHEDAFACISPVSTILNMALRKY